VHVAGVLTLIGFILFLAPYPPNNIKRVMRHPQLIGVACWGLGHLVAVGSERGIVLFAGLTIWAILEMLLINKREQRWHSACWCSWFFCIHIICFSVAPR
jgi:uncharacterized membrane protein